MLLTFNKTRIFKAGNPITADAFLQGLTEHPHCATIATNSTQLWMINFPIENFNLHHFQGQFKVQWL